MAGNILEISCWAFLILYVALLKLWKFILCHTSPFRFAHREVACALRWLQVKKKSGDNRWNQQLEDWQKSRHLWQACQTDFCLGLLYSISFASIKKTKFQQNYSVNHRKSNSRKRPACPHSDQFHGVEDPEELQVLSRIHLFGQRLPEAANSSWNPGSQGLYNSSFLKTNNLSVSGQSPADLLNAGKQMWASLGASSPRAPAEVACPGLPQCEDQARPAPETLTQARDWNVTEHQGKSRHHCVMGTNPAAPGQWGPDLPRQGEATPASLPPQSITGGHRGARDGWCWGLGALCTAGKLLQPAAGLQEHREGQHYWVPALPASVQWAPVKHLRLVIKVQAAQ